jgi:hypothetical protein
LKGVYPKTVETKATDEGPLPKMIFDPEGDFVMWWNIIQVVALTYVMLFLPIRVGWGNDPDVFSWIWFVELLIDVYFLSDIVLNFRIAFYDYTGARVVDCFEIAKNYLSGWFMIDVLGTLPITYVQLIMQGVEGEVTGGELKGLKTLRLLRLAKMLRLRKLKELLQHFGDMHGIDVDFLVNTGVMLLFIGVALHILACIYYMVGTFDDDLIMGWVTNPETGLEWDYKNPDVGTEYIVSLSTTLAQEWKFTSIEHGFNIFSTMILAVIFGSLDALLVSVLLSVNAGDQATAEKMQSLRAWMSARQLDRRTKALITNDFSSRYRRSGVFDEKEIMDSLPPQLARKVTMQMYMPHISKMPMFKNLGIELLAMICGVVEHLDIAKDTSIFEEGDIGTEMYFILDGEVEVESQGQRLGFLSDGAFFGESALVESVTGKGNDYQHRVRTVRAMMKTERGIITMENAGATLRLCPPPPPPPTHPHAHRRTNPASVPAAGVDRQTDRSACGGRP